MNIEGSIQRGQSSATDSRLAVRELHKAIAQNDTALIIFFCSSEYDLDALADEINQVFKGIQVVGCTTAGEIGPSGYRNGSLSGISFPASTFTALTASMDNLNDFIITDGQVAAHALLQELEVRAPNSGPNNSFAFLMIDGLSIREEQVARAFQNGIGKIRLFGGSAGDDIHFKRTWVFHDGAFHSNAAALILVNTAFRSGYSGPSILSARKNVWSLPRRIPRIGSSKR